MFILKEISGVEGCMDQVVSYLVLARVASCWCEMRSKSSFGEDFEGSYQEGKMSKVLMKLRLQKNINQQI
jgi:hypothetical protein